MGESISYSKLALIMILFALGCIKNLDWEVDNPLLPIPDSPLGIENNLSDLAVPPTSERVRLGRWLFFDKRLSADGTISCASCHRPENAFSEPTSVSTGIGNQKGFRKAPSFINQAWTIYPHFFWDGRAASLEAQALEPIANPVEMGNTLKAVVQTIQEIKGYAKYFKEAYGTEEINNERIAQAIADYGRTRISGNSAWDQWSLNGERGGVSEEVILGHELFFGKAKCKECHLGENLTDSSFHNLGIGWDYKKRIFADEGRFIVSNDEIDKGAFKTPTLRDVSKHAPYMHDGSIATLREVIEHYNKGGNLNPYLSKKIKPLNLDEDEITALVKFMEALDGEGYQDVMPSFFPQ